MPSYKDVCTPADLNRFACCLMHLKDGSALTAVDWDAAAADYDPKVKVASFKTVTMKAFKKAWGAVHPEEGAAPAEGEREASPKGKGKVKGAGRKRKAAAATVVAGEDGGEPAAKKTRGGKRAKKAAAEVEDDEAEEEEGEEEENIKTEMEDGVLEDFA